MSDGDPDSCDDIMCVFSGLQMLSTFQLTSGSEWTTPCVTCLPGSSLAGWCPEAGGAGGPGCWQGNAAGSAGRL